MRALWLPFLLLTLAACATQPPAPTKTAAPARPPAHDAGAEQERLIGDAMLAIEAHMPQQAIDRALDPLIATFEQRWGQDKRHVFSARTPVEATLDMLEAAKQHEESVALGPVWVDAFRLKGYALLELGRGEEARAVLARALVLAPHNAQVLEELGANWELEKNWPEAMRAFERAEEAAQTFSPEAKRNDELARAWRGQAYVEVELGKLDAAEQLYLRCLELDKNDQRAQTELEYVRNKRKDADPRDAARVRP